jgi:hypothetical protein
MHNLTIKDNITLFNIYNGIKIWNIQNKRKSKVVIFLYFFINHIMIYKKYFRSIIKRG